MLVAALSVLVKIPTLATPAFWDEMAYISQASWLADNGLWRVVPGLRSDGQFFGHPPGLHFLAASLFRVFGHSIEAAHVLIACFSAIGVAATYALVRAAHDAKIALLAALLLLLSPTWFYNAGVFLADLPVAALGTLCAVFVIRDRLLPYLVVASCMVLIKETAVALVVALVAFRLLTRWPLTRATLIDAARWAVPLLAAVTFALVQKAVTGKFFFIFDFEFAPMFDLSLQSAVLQAADISRWIFIAQSRWVLSAAIVVDLMANAEARRRRELLLFALVVLASGYAFTVIYYSSRYVIPVLPFFYALGAVSLMSLARKPRRQWATGTVAVGLTLWSLARDPYRGIGENNLQYIGIVRTNQAAARELESRYAASRIASTWPTGSQLTQPLLGYVSAPLDVKWFEGPGDLVEADVAVVARPANPQAAALEALVRSMEWPVVSTWSYGETAITLYRRPETRPTLQER